MSTRSTATSEWRGRSRHHRLRRDLPEGQVGWWWAWKYLLRGDLRKVSSRAPRDCTNTPRGCTNAPQLTKHCRVAQRSLGPSQRSRGCTDAPEPVPALPRLAPTLPGLHQRSPGLYQRVRGCTNGPRALYRRSLTAVPALSGAVPARSRVRSLGHAPCTTQGFHVIGRLEPWFAIARHGRGR